ncbi:MAG: hypothetical protein U9N42_06285 [Campylobacterota bacterium]|nr:hypothetical protein [Campylobacterota bacterium]
MKSQIEDLRKKIYEIQESGSIASLYVIEQEVSETQDDALLGGFYANILELAMERLTQALEAPRKLDMNEVEDFATLRALYEYALEHYDASSLDDASALFEILAGLSDDDKFSDAMQRHNKAIKSKINLDTFLEKVADVALTEHNGTFYISEFK